MTSTAVRDDLGSLPSRPGLRAARLTFAALLGLLAVQFLLGMYNNLYVNIDDPRHSTGTIAGHIVLGLLLVAGDAVALIATVLARRPTLVTIALLGLAGTVLAVIAGFRFLHSSNAVYSATMAVGFIVTAACDVIGLLLRRQVSQQRHGAHDNASMSGR